jgi:hypothetical protein
LKAQIDTFSVEVVSRTIDKTFALDGSEIIYSSMGDLRTKVLVGLESYDLKTAGSIPPGYERECAALVASAFEVLTKMRAGAAERNPARIADHIRRGKSLDGIPGIYCLDKGGAV